MINVLIFFEKIFKTLKLIFVKKGALIYDMLNGSPPFYSKDRNQMFKNIFEVDFHFDNYFAIIKFRNLPK